MIRETDEEGATEAARRGAERFAYATLDALSEHVAVLDARGTVVAVNRAWREFAGANSMSQKGLNEGANYFDACESAKGAGAGDAARFAEGLRAVIGGGLEEFSLEYPCHSPTERRWFIARATRFELDGEVRAVVTHANITARKLAEEATRFRSHLLDTVEQAVVATGLEGKITYWNRFAEKLYGWPAAEVVGRDIFEVVLTEDARERAAEILSRLHEGLSWSGEVTVRRRDGTTFPAHITNAPIFDDKGKVTGVVGISTDTTERKRTERLLAEQKQSLEMVVGGAPLAEVLTYLTRVVEQQADGRAVASILLLDDEGRLRNGASPSLPDDYLKAIDGLGADPEVGTCSAAAALRAVVITPDISADPKWQDFKHLPLGLGFKSAWSMPIMARDGRVLGTFGAYFRERREPEALERQTLAILARTAALAIEGKRAEDALRESEEWLRAILDASRDGILVEDDERIAYVNRAYARLLGYEDPDELRGTHISAATSPEDGERMSEYGRRRLRGEPAPTVYEFKGRRKDGALIDLEASVSTHVVSGKTYITTAVRDISERKRAEEERERLVRSLEAERSRLAYLFTHAPTFVAVLRGPDHVFDLVNPPYRQLIGYRDVLGKPVREALPEIEGQGYFELLDKVFRGGEPHVGSGMRVMVRREPDGAPEERFVDFVYQPMFDPDGAVSGIFVHGVDITEHKRAGDRARASEERYRTLFTSIDEGFCVAEVLFDASGRGVDHRHIEVNPSFAKLSGVPVEAALSGRTVRELVPNIEAHWSETFGRVVTTGVPERFVSGSEALGRWFDVYVFRVGRAEERRVAILFNNVTERKRAEEALRQSESRYRLLLEQASDGIHTYDLRGDFIETNSKLCEMLGYTREELLRLNVRDIIPPEDLARAPIRFEELQAGRTLLTERHLLRKDGTLLPVEISGRMIQDGVLQSIIRDISERKRAEGELQRAYDELERRVEERTAELARANATLKEENAERLRAEEARKELLRRLVTAQEEERRRISRELHDQMGQQLAALMMGLKALDAESHGRQSALRTLRQLQEITDQLAREVHTLAWGLRPPALDDLGLHTAIYNYVEEWAERSRVPVDFHSAGFEGARLPLSHETALYRITQEALTNVFKHSGADRVSFILERRGDHVLVVVEDNGRGFDVEAPAETSGAGRKLGLLGMRERAALVGGTLDVESAHGAGTTVFVRIPVAAGGDEGGGARG